MHENHLSKSLQVRIGEDGRISRPGLQLAALEVALGFRALAFGA